MSEPIECSSEVGITLALIEGIIAQMRLLARRDLSPHEVHEALLDMQANSPRVEDLVKR